MPLNAETEMHNPTPFYWYFAYTHKTATFLQKTAVKIPLFGSQSQVVKNLPIPHMILKSKP